MDYIKCLHCQTEFKGNFCPTCGQRFIKTPYSSKILIILLSETFDFGSKFFKTLFLLFIRPEKIINSFLKGDLNSFVSPIKLLLLVIGLLFAFELLEVYVLGIEWGENGMDNTSYLVAISLILYLSTLNRIFFKNFNWLEQLLITFYESAGLMLIFFLAGFISDILKFLSLMSDESNSWAGYMFSIILLYNLWFNARVFGKNKLKTLLKTLLIIFITIVFVLLISLI